MPAKLERLPTEILQEISALLDSVHTVSLVDFARASKHCYSVASAILFRTVKVSIADPEGGGPFQFLGGLQTRLLRDDAFKHVRRLILCPTDHFHARVDWPYTTLETCERGFEDDTGLISCWDVLARQWERNKGTIAEHEWEPVISLVERLPGLADLYWVCHEQLPLRLLNVLDSRKKLCRLHHYTFDLGTPTETPLDSYEHALTTSPSLYSIGNLNGDNASLGSARNIRSPNLRRVHFCSYTGSVQQNAIHEHQHLKLRAPALREVIHMHSGPPSSPIPFSMVQAEAFGHWSTLRVLKVNTYVDPWSLPSPSDFPSLTTLSFTITTHQTVTPEGGDRLATFLRSLTQLNILEVNDWDRSMSFTPALNKNLRTLKFNTLDYLDGDHLRDDHIHRLADLCPNLENLTLEI